MSVTESQILDALRPIVDPDFQKSIVDLGFVKDIEIEADRVSFSIELSINCSVNQMTLKNGVEATIKKFAPQIKRVIEVNGVNF